MPLLGKIIKKAIDVGGQIAETNDNPSELQQTMLRELLERAKDTAFGKAYAFEELLRSETLVEDFRSRGADI